MCRAADFFRGAANLIKHDLRVCRLAEVIAMRRNFNFVNFCGGRLSGHGRQKSESSRSSDYGEGFGKRHV